MPQSEAEARSVRGRLHLRFADRGGRTALVVCDRSPPLHVQRPLDLDQRHPSLARLALLNTTAGLFAGNSLSVRVCLDDGAAVELTTPAMTRAFGMPDGRAEVLLQVSVAPGGYLEYLPEATLLCRGAGLRLRTEVDAGPGAAMALCEVLAFGRVAHGERHAYRELDQRTVLRYGGRPVLSEGLSLRPDRSESRLGIVDDFAVYGNLHVLAGSDDCLALLAHARSRIAEAGNVCAGASLLAGDTGIAVRALGHVPSELQRFLRPIVGEFRRLGAPRLPAAIMPAGR